jgi:hypothetical protein
VMAGRTSRVFKYAGSKVETASCQSSSVMEESSVESQGAQKDEEERERERESSNR